MIRQFLVLLVIASLGACRSSTHSASATAEDIRSAPRDSASGPTAISASNTPPRRGHPADVRFMQQMHLHHRQATAMTALVPSRTQREGIRLLAERIEVSQKDELKTIERWLREHGETIPTDDGHTHVGTDSAHAAMPGMLSAQDLDSLRRAQGDRFEELFLRFMIRHHEGAIIMVTQLFRTPGAAQPSEIYQFATDVDGDQRAEIARMKAMLNALMAR